MTKRSAIRLLSLLLLATLLCGACRGGVNMHKHHRSHCDCPSF